METSGKILLVEDSSVAPTDQQRENGSAQQIERFLTIALPG